MNKVIFKSLSVENFYTFADRVFFTTEIDSAKKEYLHNTFEQSDVSYNKVSFLYGANGSGKTNFCKIMLEIQRIIDWSPISAANNNALLSVPGIKNIKRDVAKFAFDSQCNDKPSTFSLEIIIDKITYCYSFSIQGDEIIYEKLTKKFRRTETIIERLSSSYKDIILKSEFKDFEGMRQVVKKDSLCLPVAAMLNNKLAIKIISAIKSIVVLNMTSIKLDPPDIKTAFSEDRNNRYVEVIQKADPTITDIHVSIKKKEISRQKLSDDFENREIISTMTEVGVGTKHNIYKNGEITQTIQRDLFKMESLGTIKLFTMLPYLFDVLENGGVLFIDELDNGLHLSLGKELIELFTNNKTNPHNAQLICTSHQPLLLDGDFRRDQVWVTSKDDFGKSSLHRVSELSSARAKINITNKLLEGAFGCNPQKFFNIKFT